MSEKKAPRPSGKLVSKNHALPPVRVDASAWPRDLGPRTVGEFVSVNHALPPVTVGTAAPEQLFFELTLRLAAKEQPEIVAIRVASFVERLDALERSLGGSGIIWDKDRSAAQNGDLTIVVSANDAHGATDRFKQLANEINGAIGLYLATSALVTKVYRLTPAGERQDVLEIKHPGAT